MMMLLTTMVMLMMMMIMMMEYMDSPGKSKHLYLLQVLIMKDREDDRTKFIIVIMMTNIWKTIMNNQHPPSSKDIFYELENLSEIKDRTILKLFETDGSGRGALIIA